MLDRRSDQQQSTLGQLRVDVGRRKRNICTHGPPRYSHTLFSLIHLNDVSSARILRAASWPFSSSVSPSRFRSEGAAASRILSAVSSSSGAVCTNVGFPEGTGSGGRGGDADGPGLFGSPGLPSEGEAGTSRIVCSWNSRAVDGTVGVTSLSSSSWVLAAPDRDDAVVDGRCECDEEGGRTG